MLALARAWRFESSSGHHFPCGQSPKLAETAEIRLFRPCIDRLRLLASANDRKKSGAFLGAFLGVFWKGRLLAHARRSSAAQRNVVIVQLSFRAGLRACEIAGLTRLSGPVTFRPPRVIAANGLLPVCSSPDVKLVHAFAPWPPCEVKNQAVAFRYIDAIRRWKWQQRRRDARA